MNMLFLTALLFVLAGLTGGTLMLWSFRTPQPGSQTGQLPYLSIIVPARNEAKRLPDLLQSLTNQSLQAYEILVIDDASDDDTAAVAEAYGAKVIQNKGVSHMAPGKSAACAYGADCAQGDWLMFLDADVQLLGQHSLLHIVTAYQKQNEQGLLSIQPYHHITKLYENLSAVFNIIVLTGVNVFTFWQDRFKTAGSFGPCILCDKTSYQLTGGHEAAAESIMDDYALSDVFRYHQLPVRNYAGKGMIAFRMYPEGMKQLVEGWTKNLAVASQSTHWIVMVLISLWMSGAFLATAFPIVALAAGAPVWAGISAVCYLLYAAHVLCLARRAGDFNWWICLFFPALFLFFTVLFVYSFYRTHVLRTVTWKGRRIKL
ncbi:4,4'-diaponeurosporenoate glycosyltransferase [Barrientosiimonas marina]|uniref:4,4'-diaponeurosporenoate glycosyltransferase n=1 Tax=Lentibacillus kimchii TaxID=1542911 RepID=A0ABW2UXC3_9BACI